MRAYIKSNVNTSEYLRRRRPSCSTWCAGVGQVAAHGAVEARTLSVWQCLSVQLCVRVRLADCSHRCKHMYAALHANAMLIRRGASCGRRLSSRILCFRLWLVLFECAPLVRTSRNAAHRLPTTRQLHGVYSIVQGSNQRFLNTIDKTSLAATYKVWRVSCIATRLTPLCRSC